MIAPTTQCDLSQLKRLLESSAPTVDDISNHLGTCHYCQNQLQKLAAEKSIWSEATQLLQSDLELASKVEPSVASVETPSDVDSNGSTDDDIRPAFSETLAFLAPSENPSMLGRLGKYEIERVIGFGGMGVVMKGIDDELNRAVAIKVLASHLATNGAARQRFAREARAAAAVAHNHVVPIHNVETEGPIPYLVMHYVTGQSLQQQIDQNGPLDIQDVLRIGMQAADGLAAAHRQGLVHRDVKPANILLETGVPRVMISDFGLARAVDDATLTRSGFIAGTPYYMAPEQATGKMVDPRADLFSLGSVLYFACTGHPPFRADGPIAVLHRICHDRHRPIRQVNPAVPKSVAKIIDRLLDKKPKNRFEDGLRVREALAAQLTLMQNPEISPIGQRVLARAKRATHPCFALAFGLALVALFATIAATMNWRDPTHSSRPTQGSVRDANGIPASQRLNVGQSHRSGVLSDSKHQTNTLPVASLFPSQGSWERCINNIWKDVHTLEKDLDTSASTGDQGTRSIISKESTSIAKTIPPTSVAPLFPSQGSWDRYISNIWQDVRKLEKDLDPSVSTGDQGTGSITSEENALSAETFQSTHFE